MTQGAPPVIPTEPDFPQLEDDQGKRYPLARPAEDSKAATAPLRPQSAERPALQKFRTALNALYLEVEPSIANDIVDLANAAITEAEAYARAAAPAAPLPQRHGIDCEKMPHTGTGYLHAPEDDTSYDVDGVNYCGRCHQAI